MIYLDMDQVLADFISEIVKIPGHRYDKDLNAKDSPFLEQIQGTDFFYSARGIGILYEAEKDSLDYLKEELVKNINL